jgi:hypothetical protein
MRFDAEIKVIAVRVYASLAALCSAQHYDNCVSVMCKLLLLTVVIEHKVQSAATN